MSDSKDVRGAGNWRDKFVVCHFRQMHWDKNKNGSHIGTYQCIECMEREYCRYWDMVAHFFGHSDNVQCIHSWVHLQDKPG
jgi:hypothetical protein